MGSAGMRGLLFWAILACFLGCSCRKKPSVQPKQSTVEMSSAEIFDAEGKHIATLYESDTGDTLLLSFIGEEPFTIASFQDTVRQIVPDPKNEFLVVVYVRNCGVTTDYATRVDLVASESDAGKHDDKTVLIFKGSHPLNVEWKSNDTLVINYPHVKREYIYRLQTRHGKNVIEYGETSEPANETQYLEAANVNFGSTGMAGGIPEEILLRIAGWAQSKSGLTRQEWVNWYGDAPYGDDPQEQELIKQGIQIFELNRESRSLPPH